MKKCFSISKTSASVDIHGETRISLEYQLDQGQARIERLNHQIDLLNKDNIHKTKELAELKSRPIEQVRAENSSLKKLIDQLQE